MPAAHSRTTLRTLSTLFLMMFAANAGASDADELTSLVNEFLAGASTEAAHERFWADDLIYTSSRGTRTTKAEIMAGFVASDEGDDEANDAADAEDDESGPVWSADEIQVQLYGDSAVVAFKLVGTTTKSSDAETEFLYYFNTGTFVKRDDVWQVVAWQATVIPAQ